MKNIRNDINVTKIDTAITMLKKYITDTDMQPLISALEGLKQDQNNESFLQQLNAAFNDLGITQGAVLTYAPYVNILLSDDPFGND